MSRFVDDYRLDVDLYDEKLRARFGWRIPARSNIGWQILNGEPKDALRPAIHAIPAGSPAYTWSFGRLVATAKKYGRLFQALGIERGDRVGIVMPQSPELAAVHLATYAIGAIALPMSALYGPESYRFILGDSGAAAVVTHERHSSMFRSLNPNLPDLRRLIVHGEPTAGEVALEEASAFSDDLKPVDTASDDPALLLYTSGSTGHPKGVLHAHHVLEGYMFTFRLFFGPDFDERTVFYTPSDWAWVGGLLDILLPALALGYPVVADDSRFSVERAFGTIAATGVTHAFLTPTALKQLAQVTRPSERFDLELKVIASGGESVAWPLHRWAEAELGATINEFYGLTEVNHLVGGSTLWPPKPGSMGLPYPGRKVAVVDGAGEPVEPGVVGEIAVQPGDPTQMIRYWNNDAATTERMRNGWIMTGDLAHTDEDGYFYFEGRSDDIISSAGYRIGPTEIEETLLQHPAVAEVAVIGWPDQLRGEIVKAVVVLADEHNGDDRLIAELQNLVRERLAAYKYPRVIEFASELPKTTTGKVNRKSLQKASDTESERTH